MTFLVVGSGVLGLAAVVWGVRAKLAWLRVLLVPTIANATLIAAPWALSTLRHPPAVSASG